MPVLARKGDVAIVWRQDKDYNGFPYLTVSPGEAKRVYPIRLRQSMAIPMDAILGLSGYNPAGFRTSMDIDEDQMQRMQRAMYAATKRSPRLDLGEHRGHLAKLTECYVYSTPGGVMVKRDWALAPIPWASIRACGEDAALLIRFVADCDYELVSEAEIQQWLEQEVSRWQS